MAANPFPPPAYDSRTIKTALYRLTASQYVGSLHTPDEGPEDNRIDQTGSPEKLDDGAVIEYLIRGVIVSLPLLLSLPRNCYILTYEVDGKY